MKDENPAPIITLDTATTAMKGTSQCAACGARGLFSWYKGREWLHKPTCPWAKNDKKAKG